MGINDFFKKVYRRLYRLFNDNIQYEYILLMHNYRNWDNIFKSKKIDEKFIRLFEDKINGLGWISLCHHQKLSEGFIHEFQDKVNWHYISCHQKLNEDFIREFQDKVNWHFVSSTQVLSEDFIREFQNKVNWNCISLYQVLSEDFIIEFMDKFDVKFLNKIFKDINNIKKFGVPFQLFKKFIGS